MSPRDHATSPRRRGLRAYDRVLGRGYRNAKTRPRPRPSDVQILLGAAALRLSASEYSPLSPALDKDYHFVDPTSPKAVRFNAIGMLRRMAALAETVEGWNHKRAARVLREAEALYEAQPRPKGCLSLTEAKRSEVRRLMTAREEA